jgi:hypothetical protein
MSKLIVELSLAELSELLQWADNMYTKNVMSTFGADISDRLWELYKEAKAKEN